MEYDAKYPAMTAMILAAGLGTRLKPFTDHHPKALAMVNGKTVLQRNIEYLQQAGISRVVVNVHHFAGQIKEAIEAAAGWGSEVIISDETDVLLETGGGIQRAIPLFGNEKNLLVLNVDVLTDMHLQTFIAAHLASGAAATLAVTNRPSTRCFLLDNEMRLCGWKNKSTGETKMGIEKNDLLEMSFSGIHLIGESIFRHMPFEGKFSMTDVYIQLCATHRILGFDHSGGRFIDIGTPEKLAKAAALFA